MESEIYNMKYVIVYKGKYGATEQYAKWLSEILLCPVYEAGAEPEALIQRAETVILGTSVYIGRLQLKQWISSHATQMESKKIILFVVCGTPDSQNDKRMDWVKQNVPHSLLPSFRVFFLQGRLKMSKLSWKDRLLLKIGARLTPDPVERKNMLTEYDNVKKENLQPLLAAISQTAP